MPILSQIAIFLAAAVLAAPLFRRFGLGTVLGYLAAGVAIGPWGLGIVTEVEAILDLGQIGVVFLLFIIGLELQPTRLRAMRRVVFGLGLAQVLTAGCALAALAWLLGLPLRSAVIMGFALSLSSTAFVLQMLAERHQLRAPHGRGAFGILLFQDLAVIPMLALIPLLAPVTRTVDPAHLLLAAVQAAAVVVGFVIAGHYLLRPVLRLIAAARSREIFLAGALLLVLGSALLMESIGLSMGLGAFLAGVLVADSEYRHQLEADIKPFEGLLLGLFFMAVGMTIDLGLVLQRPLTVFALALGLLAVKTLLLLPLGLRFGLPRAEARRLGVVLAQGSEFAFVLFTVARNQNVLSNEVTALMTAVVTVSMAATPLLIWLDGRWANRTKRDQRPFDTIEGTPDHRVVIAGFGRFGQVVGRLLGSQGIPFTALESNPTHVDFVRQFGHRIYYGDATRLELLRSAGVHRAHVFVLAVDDVEASLKIARLVRHHFPDIQLHARARNRHHAHQLMDLGCTAFIRETLLSSLWLTGETMKGLGMAPAQADAAVALFRKHDHRTLEQQYAIRDDREALVQSALEAARELRELFESDAQNWNRKR